MAWQVDANLWCHARAYARCHDQLNQHAFGNFRNLLEDISLSPAMGIYLSHLRNRKEDAATGRMPDENFAREVMQLFSIGLYELNLDGSLKRDANGKPVETYTNTDVMALAKVFTGWGWAYADTDLTDSKFRWGSPVVSAAGDQRIDLLPMKAYPNQHSTAAKSLFAGKAWATNIPANGIPQADLKLALDALFNHPNVGPFIGRQLIQRLVTSQPSAAYVARVAGVFNHNDRGVRGDLGAVVRAILLDTDARGTPSAGSGKLLEPVLRVAQWMRALGARSASGYYLMVWDLDAAGQRALLAPSVFGYYRPGYVPPNTRFAATGSTAPEFQIVNESSVAAWINTAESMAGSGLGWTSTGADVSVDHDALGALADNGDPGALVQQLNLLLLGGRMSPALQQGLLDTVASVGPGTSAAAHRARAATFFGVGVRRIPDTALSAPKQHPMHASRRAFFRTAASLAAATAHPLTAGLNLRMAAMATQLAGLGALAASQAQAANTGDGYKALVCLYMAGGNDSHNWIVPTDTGNRATYASARGELAWPADKVQAITSSTQGSGRSFGMPLELAPLRSWYEQGQCAVVANVGTLVRPTTKAEFKAGVGLPAKLFSHNDQAATTRHHQHAANGIGGQHRGRIAHHGHHPAQRQRVGAGHRRAGQTTAGGGAAGCCQPRPGHEAAGVHGADRRLRQPFKPDARPAPADGPGGPIRELVLGCAADARPAEQRAAVHRQRLWPHPGQQR